MGIKKCCICRKKPATVPDRNIQFSQIKKLCDDCHGSRLKGDLIEIIDLERKKMKKEEINNGN